MDVTALVITFNEIQNIGRTLERLAWAKRIVIIDSGSTDGTLEVAGGYPQVEIIHRAFDSFAEQCNFGLAQIASEWVLSLDADYELSEALAAEIQALAPTAVTQGYRANFVYRIWGRPLRGTLYPPRVALYRKDAGRYVNEGHGHRLAIEGRIDLLRGVIFHDDRKPLGRWFESQRRYAAAEAEHLLSSPPEALRTNDRVRLSGWLAPLLVLPYVLIAKGCLFDGWPGWFYALQRLLAESVIALELLDRRVGDAPSPPKTDPPLRESP
jgi:glycosyltransferase involved in cell wall biosynthesis